MTDDEALHLAENCVALASRDHSNPLVYRHDEIEWRARNLRGSSFDSIRSFGLVSNEYGTLMVKGIPIDPFLPATPKDGRRPSHKLPVSEAGVALLGCLVGDVFSYADEKEGLLIQNICPVEGQEEKQENTGSVFLEYHTEDSFHPLPPDFLVLACLRGDRTNRAITATASILRAVHHLDDHTIEQLKRADFTVRSSSSFGKSEYAKRVAVLDYTGGELRFTFDPSAMQADHQQARLALDNLHSALQRETYGCCLRPNEAILIDNRKACHARTAFLPFYDGEDRWLQRSFLTKRFPPYQGFLLSGTRMVDPLKVREFSL